VSNIEELGKNNIESVEAITLSYTMDLNRNPDIDEEMYSGFEDNLRQRFEEYQKGLKTINIYLFTIRGLTEAI